MSNGKHPLVLMMALSVPGAAHALGLGDIHVDSALNERLAAQIDIVGATALELADLKAAVASREIFARYGAERPAFITSATFKVTQDRRGRPVLAVRSGESFTDPVVNFLVDLNWHKGQLIVSTPAARSGRVRRPHGAVATKRPLPYRQQWPHRRRRPCAGCAPAAQTVDAKTARPPAR